MTDSVWMFLVSLILSLLVLGFFVAFYLYEQRNEVRIFWFSIREKTRLRIDMMPNLIEALRRHKIADESFIEALIGLRNSCWPPEEITSAKVNGELTLSNFLHKIWSAANKRPELLYDINFLAMQKEIIELGAEIEKVEDIYNEKVRAFNSKLNFILIRPFLKVLKLRKLDIFEFEK